MNRVIKKRTINSKYNQNLAVRYRKKNQHKRQKRIAQLEGGGNFYTICKSVGICNYKLIPEIIKLVELL